MFKIKRNFKTDEVINKNLFDNESFNKAMDEFILNDGHLLRPFDIDTHDKSIAKIIDYDDEYLYLSEIEDDKILNNLSDYKCQFYTSSNNVVTNDIGISIYYIDSIKKIRIMKDIEEEYYG